MSSFLHPRARSAPFPSPLSLHRHGSPQTRGQMGTATTYSTVRSAPGGGTSYVLSDCAHNLSRGGSGQRRGTARLHSSVTWTCTGRCHSCCEHITSGKTSLGLRHARSMSSQHPRPGPPHCSSTVEDQRLMRRGECSHLKNPSLVNGPTRSKHSRRTQASLRLARKPDFSHANPFIRTQTR